MINSILSEVWRHLDLPMQTSPSVAVGSLQVRENVGSIEWRLSIDGGQERPVPLQYTFLPNWLYLVKTIDIQKCTMYNGQLLFDRLRIGVIVENIYDITILEETSLPNCFFFWQPRWNKCFFKIHKHVWNFNEIQQQYKQLYLLYLTVKIWNQNKHE